LLILTRKTGETIAIGSDIKVQIIDIRGKQVRLGIMAPNMVPVHRQEIFERIQEANRQAAGLAPDDLSEITSFWEKRKRSARGKP